MVSTGVPQSHSDAFVRASAGLRERFEAQVVGAESWTEGVAAALADTGDGLAEELEAVRMPVPDLHLVGARMRRAYDEDRPARMASMTRAWLHHHPGAPVPELQLEFFIGAVTHAVDAAVQRGDLEDLPTRLSALTTLAPVAAV
jgi:hypothetical protein